MGVSFESDAKIMKIVGLTWKTPFQKKTALQESVVLEGWGYAPYKKGGTPPRSSGIEVSIGVVGALVPS